MKKFRIRRRPRKFVTEPGPSKTDSHRSVSHEATRENYALSCGGCLDIQVFGDVMESFRIFFCARCNKETRICRNCDRGNIYCGPECGKQKRAEPHRRAVSRYQKSPIGKIKHRVNQSRYRHKSDPQLVWVKCHTKNVTDQGTEIIAPVVPCLDNQEVQADTRQVIEVPKQALLSTRNAPDRLERSDEKVSCDFCGRLGGPFFRFGFSRCGSPTLRFRVSKS